MSYSRHPDPKQETKRGESPARRSREAEENIPFRQGQPTLPGRWPLLKTGERGKGEIYTTVSRRERGLSQFGNESARLLSGCDRTHTLFLHPVPVERERFQYSRLGDE